MGIDSNNRTDGGAAYTRFAEEMDIDSVDLSVRGSKSTSQRLKAACLEHWRLLLVLLIALLCLGIGLILGHLTAASCLVESVTNGKHVATAPASTTASTPTGIPITTTTASPVPTTSSGPRQPVDYLKQIPQLISKRRLQTSLSQYSQRAHHAGSNANAARGEDIFTAWQDYGFDVQRKRYSVLLSRPDSRKRNKLQIVSATTQAVLRNFTLNDGADSNMLQPFAVYGPNATIVGKPVYVNFARREDFDHLSDLTPIQVQGKICLARLGKISLAQMARVSFERLCSGLIAFRDPKPFAHADGIANTAGAGSPLAGRTYPNSWWLPPTGIPMESARLTMGDPSSPSFPSHDWMPRQSLSGDMQGFPVQTISYQDAGILLSVMKAPPAREANWIGGFQNYYVGPGFHEENRDLRLEVNNQLVFTNITNVVATIEGAVEPDRYVIIGSHRDSLSNGVVSPGTGTACLLEVAKVLSDLQKRGWRPRRSIILASWDAGEDGSIGSTEWIEENLERLRWRGVAYINLDNAVNGNYSMAAAGSPLLAKAIFQAAMNVDCPEVSHPMTVYQDWAERRPTGGTSNLPRVDALGQTNDAAPFLMLAGVPSVDLQYTYDEDFYAVPRYPTSQTVFDKSENIMVFIDPSWDIHAALTEVVTRTLITLADSPKLTMDLTHYADALTRYIRDFKAEFGSKLTSQRISLDRLEAAVAEFATAAQDFQRAFDAVDENNELKLREMNDHILAVERAFLLNEWIPSNPESRHVVYSASPSAVYKGAPFGLLAQVIALQSEQGDWSVVDQTLGLTTLGLQAATGVLKDAQLH